MFRSSYKIATVWGIPIKLHISILLMLPFLARNFGGLTQGIILEIGLLTSIVLHELGHSIVAIKKGCRVREILLMPIGGAAQMEQIPTKPLDEFLMAIAGPAVSLALGLGGVFGAPFIINAGLTATGLTLFRLGIINCSLVIFNLMPSFPMDGGRVFRAMLTPKLGRLRATFIAARLGKILSTLAGVAAAIHGHWFLVAIAFFIHIAAGKEYQLVEMQERARRNQGAGAGFTPPPQNWWSDDLNDDQVSISPPPYDKGPGQKADLHTDEDDDDPFQRLFRR